MTSEVQAAIGDLVEGACPRSGAPRPRARRDHGRGRRRRADRRRCSSRCARAARRWPSSIAAAEALRARAVTATARDPRTIDTCGTGGDGPRHVQHLDRRGPRRRRAPACRSPSTATAPPRAARGSPTCSRRSASRSICRSSACAAILDEVGIGFFFARRRHPAMRHVAPVRARARRSARSSTARAAAHPGRRVATSSSASSARSSSSRSRPAAGTRRRRGPGRARRGRPRRAHDDGAHSGGAGPRRPRRADPIDALAARAPRAPRSPSLRGGDAAENARTRERSWPGSTGARRDVVLLNAAAALWVVGRRLAAEGIERAAAEHRPGVARRRGSRRCSRRPTKRTSRGRMNVLDRILAHKRDEVAARRRCERRALARGSASRRAAGRRASRGAARRARAARDRRDQAGVAEQGRDPRGLRRREIAHA